MLQIMGLIRRQSAAAWTANVCQWIYAESEKIPLLIPAFSSRPTCCPDSY